MTFTITDIGTFFHNIRTETCHITSSDGRFTVCSYREPELVNELVRHANAFDELLSFVRGYEMLPGATGLHHTEAQHLLAKYDVPSTEA